MVFSKAALQKRGSIEPMEPPLDPPLACRVFYIFGHKMILVQVEKKNITESTISPKYKFGSGINCERGKIVNWFITSWFTGPIEVLYASSSYSVELHT